MRSEPGRVGIVGLGDFGLFCVEAFKRASDLDVIAVADPRPDLAQRVGELGPIRTYSDWHELMQDEHVEVVHIATPPFTHHEIAMEAARYGKSVLVEKPLALLLSDADTMIEAFRDSNLTLGIDYVMRFQPAYCLLIDLAKRNLLGSLHRISLENGAQAVPGNHWFWDRGKSGGILVEHGVHFFDVFRQIAGEGNPRSCWDQTARIQADVSYVSGATGTFFHDFSLDPSVERLDASLVFDLGTAHIIGWIPVSLNIRALVQDNAPAWNDIVAKYPDATMSLSGEVISVSMTMPDREESYERSVVQAMRDVMTAHRDPTKTPTASPEDARASLALALSAQALAKESGETAL